ncbi:MAG: hypothetical protein RLZZ238_1789 [Planctomycetota bacterium]|jgi:hypothetical protein
MVSSRIATLLLVAAAPLASACSSTPSAREVERLGVRSVVGAWTSELDGSVATFADDGSYRLERTARGTMPAIAVEGRWSDRGTAIAIIDERGSPCGGAEGVYEPEVVRDTVRFTLRRDECAEREERFAWPWRRSAGAR